MGHTLPVYFLPIRLECDKPNTAHDAFDLLPEAYFIDHQILGTREWWSKNWWYNLLVRDVAKALSRRGLEFLEEEVAYLESADLDRALDATRAVIEAFRSDAARALMNDPEFKPYWSWIMDDMSPGVLDSAIDTYEVHEDRPPHEDAALAFASALVGLEQVLTRADEVGGLLFVAIQP